MRDLDIHDIRIRARMYKSGLITEQELINAVEALLQQTHVSGRSEQLPLADACSFAEWIAKNDEWFWISEDGIWKKDGWRSRTTPELYELFSGNCH